jgi:uncharacterized protein
MPTKKSVRPDETVEPAETPAPVQSAAPAPAPVPPVPPQAPYPAPLQMTPGDERTWAMLSHLSVLLNLLTGFAGPIAALIIYLVYKDRSRYVAYHSLQSLVFQLIWWIGSGVLAAITWAIAGALTAVCIGVVLYPVALLFTLLPVGALVYGIIGAVQTNQGQDFKYWLVGDWVRGTLTG